MKDINLLLELTREVLDLQSEKKKYNKETNDKIKAVQLRIREAVKDEG